MRIIHQYAEILGCNGQPLDGWAILRHIEQCGRVCYKSEHKITETSAPDFVQKIIARGHESVLEHASITVRFVTDRGVTHEIVRHRIASYSQESSRYCCYADDRFGNEITVIKPVLLPEESARYAAWQQSCEAAEQGYMRMVKAGAVPQQARAVLPTCLKTELIMTANLREWRHFLRLRASAGAHPQMRDLAIQLRQQLREAVPVVFDTL